MCQKTFSGHLILALIESFPTSDSNSMHTHCLLWILIVSPASCYCYCSGIMAKMPNLRSALEMPKHGSLRFSNPYIGCWYLSQQIWLKLLASWVFCKSIHNPGLLQHFYTEIIDTPWIFGILKNLNHALAQFKHSWDTLTVTFSKTIMFGVTVSIHDMYVTLSSCL